MPQMAAAKEIPRVVVMDEKHADQARSPAMNAVVRWWRDERGVTAIEYGLLASLIVIAALGAMTNLGAAVFNLFQQWTQAVLAAL
jgi:pilus assembly protein Flp/PilA